MSAGLQGDVSKLLRLAKILRRMPVTLAQAVATKVAPDLSGRAQASFAAGQSVYGEARPAGVNGNALSLTRTGRTAASLVFVAIGTRVRCKLGTPWAKYLIRYGLLPNGGAAMPTSWSEGIKEIVQERIEDRLEGGL